MDKLKTKIHNLDKLEASGLIAATRFARRVAHSGSKINIGLVYELHKMIYKKAQPDIAGVLRDCEIKKLYKHIPPHSSKVPGLMCIFSRELDGKIKQLDKARDKEIDEARFLEILNVAIWASHKISYIHPFHNGNGKTARLMLNIILERYGLPLVTIPEDMRMRYLESLVQIDKYGDFEPFIFLAAELVGKYYKKLETQKINYIKSKKFHKKS